MKKLKKKKQVRILSVIFAVGAFFVVLMFFVTAKVIGDGVVKQCNFAQAKYENDCVEGLIAVVDDEKNDFRTRNSAIWTLGQLGDKRALPVLEKYYTGHIPSKEFLDKEISQYELQKAINLVNGGINITQFFWRR